MDDAQVQYDLGAVLERQGNRAGAIAEYQKVLNQYVGQAETDPVVAIVCAEALYAIGESQRQLGQSDDALVTFARVWIEFPQRRSACAEAKLQCGKIYEKKGEKLVALGHYRDVLQSYSDKINRADFARARIASLLDGGLTLTDEAKTELESAILVYETTKREDETITAARRQARDKGRAGSVDTARAELVTLFALPSVQTSWGRLSALGSTQLTIRDTNNARTTFNKLLEMALREMMPADYRFLRADVAYCQHDLAAAISEANLYLSAYPNGSRRCEAQMYAALAYDDLGQVGNCLTAYDAVISGYGSSTNTDTRQVVSFALAKKARRLAKQGNKDAAMTLFQRVIAEYAETPMAASAANSLRTLRQGGSL